MKTYILLFLLLFGSKISFSQVKEIQPLSIGTVYKFQSTVLGEERQINVYLPPNYKNDDSISFPVIYILDGGLDQDFIQVVGVLHFNMLPWISKIPSSIIVGIGGNMRRRDFTFPVENLDFLKEEGFEVKHFPYYGGSTKYMDFLEKELFDLIASKCKATNHRTVIGESAAGLFASEILLKRPYLFDKYIIMSPSLWWGNRELLKNAVTYFQTNLKEEKEVYIGIPQREELESMYNDAESFYQIMKSQPLLTIYRDYLPNETHATVLLPALMNACNVWQKK